MPLFDNWVLSSLVFRFVGKAMELMKTHGNQSWDWGIAWNFVTFLWICYFVIYFSNYASRYFIVTLHLTGTVLRL